MALKNSGLNNSSLSNNDFKRLVLRTDFKKVPCFKKVYQQMNNDNTSLIITLQARANLYQKIRAFFAEQGVLEVETPILSSAGATDVHLASVMAYRHMAGKRHCHYLQTSPEFAMKRLLACGVGAIYQICKVFRDDEHSNRHNSEFTMLEWYRPHFSLDELMAEVIALVGQCLEQPIKVRRLSYKHAFLAKLGIDPLTATLAQLKQKAYDYGLASDLGDDKIAYVDFLFGVAVEPALDTLALTTQVALMGSGDVNDTTANAYPKNAHQKNTHQESAKNAILAVFLTDFPKELASLAKVHKDRDGVAVAARFELYINGLELANGYDELADSKALYERFLADNKKREQLGLPTMPIDERLLKTIDTMPRCAGVALGLDRLLMVQRHTQTIAEVLSFTAFDA